MDHVCYFGEPRAIRICPVMIITFVRIMPGQDNPVGPLQTVSIVLQIIGVVSIIEMCIRVFASEIFNQYTATVKDKTFEHTIQSYSK